MAIPDLLVSRHTVTGGGVFTLSGGITLTQIGSTFTASLENIATDENYGCGSVVEFQGKRYVWHRNEIREENTGGVGTWGVVHTVANQVNTNNYTRRSGLHVVENNGTNYLVGVFSNATHQLSAVQTTDGTTWTETSPVNGLVISSARRGRSIVYRNQLYWHIASVGSGIYRYNPATFSGTIIEMEDLVDNNANLDFCVFGGELFAAGSVGTTATLQPRLWKLRNNAFDSVLTFNADNGNNGEQGSCVLFTDNTNLFTILNGRDGSNVVGNTAWRINNPNSSPTATDITTTVLPAAFQPGGISATDNNRWHSYANNTVPGSIEIFLWRIPGPTGTHEAFQWQGDTLAMTSLGISDVTFTESIYLPNTKFGGGERIDGGVKIYAEMENQTTLDAGGEISISYRVYGSGADQTLSLYYNNNDQIPTAAATLTGATGGSSSLSGGSIIDVTPDNGVTLYTLTWDAVTDGISALDQPKLMIDLQ